MSQKQFRIYGIKNCDTMKKAFKHLDSHQIDYTFVDYKKQSPDLADLERWHQAFGEWPVNKRGTTYRKIKEAFEAANDAEKAQLLLSNLSALKRPILEGPDTLLRGFDAALWPH